MPPPPSAAIALPDVIDFRRRAIANGFTVIRVRSRHKEAIGDHITGDPRALLDLSAGSANSGVLARGLRAVDLDADDPTCCAALRLAAETLLAPTIVRGRADAHRLLLVYRAAQGEPPYRQICGPGHVHDSSLGHKVDVLGFGNQFVAHGIHPDGCRYAWENGVGPDRMQRARLPSVTEDQVRRFLAAAQRILRLTAGWERPGRTASGRPVAAWVADTRPPDWYAAAMRDLDRAVSIGEDWNTAGHGGIGGLLRAGWSQPEDWGVWGVGASHRMVLEPAEPAVARLAIDFDVQVSMPRRRQHQAIDVVLDGRHVDTWHFAPTSNRTIRTLPVAWQGAGRPITLDFRPHATLSPRHFDPRLSDERPLGLAVHRIRLRDADDPVRP